MQNQQRAQNHAQHTSTYKHNVVRTRHPPLICRCWLIQNSVVFVVFVYVHCFEGMAKYVMLLLIAVVQKQTSISTTIKYVGNTHQTVSHNIKQYANQARTMQKHQEG